MNSAISWMGMISSLCNVTDWDVCTTRWQFGLVARTGSGAVMCHDSCVDFGAV